MTVEKVVYARDRRFMATRAAAHIGLMGRKTGISVEGISWDILPTLPQWCFAANAQRQIVQRICGALYLAPRLQCSIDGSLLRKMCGLVGEDVFHKIRTADNLSHNVSGELVEQKLDVQVMASGSSVLLGTLNDPTLLKLYTTIVGPPGDEVSVGLAQEIYATAVPLIDLGYQDNLVSA